MTKLGTPIGAGPNWAMVRPGLEGAGDPSGLRSAGFSIFSRSPLATSLAPWPFLACLPKRPGALSPAVFLVALPPPELVLPAALPPPELGVVVVVVVVVVVLPPEPLEPPLPPLDVGALYSEVSTGPVQPGSLRSVRPSPSLSERSAHCGRAPVVGTLTVTLPTPTVPEIAVPAA